MKLALLLLLTSSAAAADVTAYCHCKRCCGRAGQPAANGKPPVAGVTVAGPRSVPLGTHVHIEGLGVRIVTDRTALRFDGRYDIFMRSHTAALQFGKRNLKVSVIP